MLGKLPVAFYPAFISIKDNLVPILNANFHSNVAIKKAHFFIASLIGKK